jgi:hypothetical protein
MEIDTPIESGSDCRGLGFGTCGLCYSMNMKAYCALLLASLATAQPVSVKLDHGFTLTAENLVHSLPAPVEKAPEMSIDERVQKAALPEGESKMPVSGLLYFPYGGKTKKIKSVELTYQGPAGTGEIKLP